MLMWIAMATYEYEFNIKIINMQENYQNKTFTLINTLGNLIKKHRKEQGKTMYAISAEVSMSKSTWREAEIGACKDIKLTTLWKIAEGLDIPLATLIDELSKKLGDNFSLSDLK